MATLHLVTGAPGSGKSTVLPHLAEHPFAAADFDELLDADGSLMGTVVARPSASPLWPAYNRLWVRIIGMMLRGGGPVLVTCPLTPDEWAAAAAGAGDAPPVAWARLDCDDADRRARLAARGWGPDRVVDAIEDAHALRRLVDREFTTSGRGAAEVAADLAAWVATAKEPRSRHVERARRWGAVEDAEASHTQEKRHR
ncbi:AAA family ATPase [Streptomyces sp. PT12]|uniref:AAA family ATPase n=1 Tax=Streptomyces sp. PT12 TaxID=1510197 RepID=UPI0015EE7F7C|nr:AAA family ATPase [Streptomyces sp. PT12]